MSKFKVGDRVRIGPTNGGYFPNDLQGLIPGNSGTVIQVFDNGAYGVRTDNAEEPLTLEGDGWEFYDHEIELIQEAEGGDA